MMNPLSTFPSIACSMHGFACYPPRTPFATRIQNASCAFTNRLTPFPLTSLPAHSEIIRFNPT